MAGKKFKPQFRRILHIHRLLNSNTYPTASVIAEDRDIECSPRTVKRDIQYMRYDLNAPIEYDPLRNGYYYTEPGWELPSPLMITEGELFSLAIAEHIFEQYRHTPIFPALENLFGKIEEMLPANVTIGKEWLHSVFSFSSIPGVQIEPNIWGELFLGMKNGKKINIWYKAPGYAKGLRRTLSPYHLFCNDAQWYVIGHDSYSSEIRLFALHRIEKIELTNKGFSVPEDFNYRNYIDAPLGMFIDDDLHNVELLFYKDAAPYILEREWHPEQIIEETKDNGIILKFQTRQLTSVLYWVLSWGGSVKVLAPDKLIEMIKKSLSSALELY